MSSASGALCAGTDSDAGHCTSAHKQVTLACVRAHFAADDEELANLSEVEVSWLLPADGTAFEVGKASNLQAKSMDYCTTVLGREATPADRGAVRTVPNTMTVYRAS
jgi:hypothetical protein